MKESRMTESGACIVTESVEIERMRYDPTVSPVTTTVWAVRPGKPDRTATHGGPAIACIARLTLNTPGGMAMGALGEDCRTSPKPGARRGGPNTFRSKTLAAAESIESGGTTVLTARPEGNIAPPDDAIPSRLSAAAHITAVIPSDRISTIRIRGYIIVRT